MRQLQKQYGIAHDTELKRAGEAKPARKQYRVSPAFGDRYRLAGEIGRGGMGIILDAKDVRIHRELAIKVLQSEGRPTPELVAKFVEEAQIQGQLQHPNICPVHDLGIDSTGRVYFTMKKVRGESLKLILKKLKHADKESGIHERYSLVRLLEIFSKVCDAVAFAHSRGVIHRDLKPSNIMVGEYGEVLVMDWGLAKIRGLDEGDPDDKVVVSWSADEDSTQSVEGSIRGTPAFMSPEQACGKDAEIDERTDVYMLGGLLYAMLTLERPIQGRTLHQVLYRVLTHEITPPSRRSPGRMVPFDLEAAVLKALSLNPRDRYQNVAGLRDDVTAFLEGRTLRAAEYSAVRVLWKWILRNKAVSIITLVALIILAGLTAGYVHRLKQTNQRTLRAKIEAEHQRRLADAQRIIAENKTKEAQKSRHLAEEKGKEAEAQKRLAQDRLAESLMHYGDSLGGAGLWQEARTRYWEALEAFHALGKDPWKVHLALWDAFQHRPGRLLAYQAPSNIKCLAFSPDGRFILLSLSNGALALLQAMTTQKRLSFKTEGVIQCFAFSPDGKNVLGGSDAGDVWLWDVDKGGQARWMAKGCHAGKVHHVAWAPDGKHAVSGGGDGRVIVWDVQAGTPIKTKAAHRGAVKFMVFSPNGKRLITGGKRPPLILWDVASVEEIRIFPKTLNQVECADVSPDGQYAVAGYDNAVIKLWSLKTGEELRQFIGHSGPIRSLAFTHDGKLLSGAGTTVRMWDVRTGRQIRILSEFHEPVSRMALSPDEEMVVCGMLDKGVSLWKLEEGLNVQTIRIEEAYIPRLAISPDGNMFCMGLGRDVGLFDIHTGLALKSFAGHAKRVCGVAFTGDGRWLASCGGDGKVLLWDIETGALLKTLVAPAGFPTDVAFSPDGKLAAVGTSTGLVVVWHVTEARRYREFQGPAQRYVTAVRFTPDGRSMICSFDDGVSQMRDLAGGSVRQIFETHGGKLNGAAVSGDGRYLLIPARKGELHVRDLQTGGVVHVFSGHKGLVLDTVFSPDARMAYSVSEDRTLRVWDMQSGRELRVFRDHAQGITAMAISPDGSRIVTASRDKTVKIWDFSRYNMHEKYKKLFSDRFGLVDGYRESPDLLRQLGEWYAMRGIWDWSIECMERAKGLGEDVSSLLLARSYWRTQQYMEAFREFSIALEKREAAAGYLKLCLAAVKDAGAAFARGPEDEF